MGGNIPKRRAAIITVAIVALVGLTAAAFIASGRDTTTEVPPDSTSSRVDQPVWQVDIPPELESVGYAQETTVVDGQAALTVAGASILVPEGVAPDGTLVSVSIFEAPPANVNSGLRRSKLAGPVDFHLDGAWEGRVEITLPVDVEPGESAVLVHFDKEAGVWLPEPDSVFDPVAQTVTATLSNLSQVDAIWERVAGAASDAKDWTTDGLADVGSWASYTVSDVFGNRADPPTCNGELPEWVKDIFSVQDRNAALLVCGEAQGDDLLVRVVANRGYSMTLEADIPFSSPRAATVNLGAGIGQSFHTALSNKRPGIGYVPAGSEAVLLFPRPEGLSPSEAVVNIRVRIDGWSILGDVLVKAFSGTNIQGSDLVGLFECGITVLETAGAQADGDFVGFATAGVRGMIDCADPVAQALGGAVARRVLIAINIWDLSATAGDAAVDAIVNSADFQIFLDPQSLAEDGGSADGPAHQSQPCPDALQETQIDPHQVDSTHCFGSYAMIQWSPLTGGSLEVLVQDGGSWTRVNFLDSERNRVQFALEDMGLSVGDAAGLCEDWVSNASYAARFPPGYHCGLTRPLYWLSAGSFGPDISLRTTLTESAISSLKPLFGEPRPPVSCGRRDDYTIHEWPGFYLVEGAGGTIDGYLYAGTEPELARTDGIQIEDRRLKLPGRVDQSFQGTWAADDLWSAIGAQPPARIFDGAMTIWVTGDYVYDSVIGLSAGYDCTSYIIDGPGTSATTTTTTVPSYEFIIKPTAGGAVWGWGANPCTVSTPANCRKIYTVGTFVDIVATPDPGFEVVEWITGTFNGAGNCVSSQLGAGSAAHPDSLCVVEASQDRVIEVRFEPIPTTTTTTLAPTTTTTVLTQTFELRTYSGITGAFGSVVSSPPGIACFFSRDADCIERFPAGTTVVLSATPPPTEDWVVTGWIGAPCGTSSECAVTMNSDLVVYATWGSGGG